MPSSDEETWSNIGERERFSVLFRLKASAVVRSCDSGVPADSRSEAEVEGEKQCGQRKAGKNEQREYPDDHCEESDAGDHVL